MSIRAEAKVARELGLIKYESDYVCECGNKMRYAKGRGICVPCGNAYSNIQYRGKDMPRKFEGTSRQIEPGKFRLVQNIKCSNCGDEDEIANTSGSGMFPPRVAESKFIQRGWRVGKNESRDKCKICVEKEKFGKKNPKVSPQTFDGMTTPTKIGALDLPPMSKEITPMDAHNHTCGGGTNGASALHLLPAAVTGLPIGEMPPVRAETPREPTKLEKRIIIEAIIAVYGDEKTGYKDGYTDKLVAEETKMRPGWVRRLREENFGVEMPAIDFGALKIELAAMGAKAKDLYASAEEMMDRATALSIEVVKLRGEAETRFRDAGLVVDQMNTFGGKLSLLEAR